MRIAFIDHHYHAKTKSTAFFLKEILDGHQVDIFWDDETETNVPLNVKPILAGNYDRIIVWQVWPPTEQLLKRGATNVTYVPMWDGSEDLTIDEWQRLSGARILSFCHALHQIVSLAGLASLYIQYWPDPMRFAPVEDFSTLRGFFWKRKERVSWKDVQALIGSQPFERVHVHLARDPDADEADDPIAADADGRVTVSRWLESAAAFQELLGRHNVYFAPRISEGIGFSFLEAMCRGMAVVAVDQPTMSEYVTDGVNGLLWSLADPQELDFARAAELGRRARAQAILGHSRWRSSVEDVRRFVLGADIDAAGPGVGAGGPHGGAMSALPALPAAADGAADVKVTVALVTRNCVDLVEPTLASILAQSYPNIEIVAVDGASTDGTLAVLQGHAGQIATLVSEADEGPYFAMNKAAQLATGDYILFMNAGDFFASNHAVADVMAGLPSGTPPDFVIGHHLYRTAEQGDALHRAADFEITWARLKDGAIDVRWLAGIPCHQATFTRRALLAADGYDTSYRIVADHEFLYRQREKGATFHHSDELIAIYSSGGLSWNRRIETYDEWKAVLTRYGTAAGAERVDTELRDHLEREALGKPRYGQVRVRGFLSKWQRSFRMRRDMMLLKQSGLFFPNWYAEQNPEAKSARGGPLRHYLRYGAFENRDPSPFFDTRFYLLTQADARRSGMLPALFYARHGAQRNDPTTPWFAALWAEIGATAPKGTTPVERVIKWFAATPAEEMIATCRRAGVDVDAAKWTRT